METASCPNVLQGASANMFAALINTLMAAQCGLGPDGKYPPDYGPKLKDGDEFDFIIVGGGTAGSVLANRLSEVPEWKVLLLEAGGYPSGMSEIPALVFTLQDSDEDWQYKTEPSKTCCLSQPDSRCRCPRGKGLGGSSLLSSMLYTRSTKHDHDVWSSNGNTGWDYATASKYYAKLENVHVPNSTYGKQGELHITQYTFPHPIRHALQNSYEELGYEKYSEDNPRGFQDMLTTIYEGTRQSSSKAYLMNAKGRSNLFVAINAHVKKLVVNGQKVKGVQVEIQKNMVTFQARREVVLSAGTIDTPKILLNSGIGPAEELGGKAWKNLPVGRNLQDHVILPTFAVALPQSAFTPEPPLHLIDQLYKFFVHKEGDLSTVALANFASFISTDSASDFANVELLHLPIPLQNTFLLQELVRCLALPASVAETLAKHNQNSPLLLIAPILLRPKSRGVVRLPNSKTSISPNYFSDQNGEDLLALLKSVRFAQKLIATEALAQYNPVPIQPNVTNCQFESNSDEFWKCVIRNTATTVYHLVGTCKMGGAGDAERVVDPRLKVVGVEGLRVVDASVIPNALSANPLAAVFMVAEKGAGMIKEDWLLNTKS